MTDDFIQPKFCPLMHDQGTSVTCSHEQCMFWRCIWEDIDGRHFDCVIAHALAMIAVTTGDE